MEWLMISSGTGPDECHIAVKKMVEYLQNRHGVILVDFQKSKHGFFSAIVSSEESIFNEYVGTIKWQCESPIRKNWKRKNWFITGKKLKTETSLKFNEQDIRYETCKSSGPGGQHVNKTDSAVRATHIPTGIQVFSQEERSQFRNKKLALAKIIEKLEVIENEKNKNKKNQEWKIHNSLERGGEHKIFKGLSFESVL